MTGVGCGGGCHVFVNACEGDRCACGASTWRGSSSASHNTPHRCPVCDGRGSVPRGFYMTYLTGSSTSAMPEVCRSCAGLGVLWR